jgi:hypothetical protein
MVRNGHFDKMDPFDDLGVRESNNNFCKTITAAAGRFETNFLNDF